MIHPTHTHPALLPKFITEFRCIGSECEDTCCASWMITLDKKTYNAYKQAPSPELRNSFQKHTKRTRSSRNDMQYAVIVLNPETKACPLVEDGLCGVQKNMGEDALSNTCFVYPRQPRKFGGQYEQTMTLSCPEAARKALLTADAMDFVQAPITVREDVVTQIAPMRGLTNALMDEIRIFCMQLVRTQGLPIWQRLAVLGVFCDELTRTIAEDRGHAAITAGIESFTLMVESGRIFDAFKDIKPDLEEQAKLFTLLMSGNNNLPSPVHVQVQDAIIAGLGADQDGKVVLATMIDCYSQGLGRLPQALEQAAPYLLENYLVNEMFRTLFPFNGQSIYDQYLQTVSRFGILRLMLAAQCGPSRELPTQEDLVKTVHVFARRFQHSPVFANKVNNFLKDTGRDSLVQVFRFLAE